MGVDRSDEVRFLMGFKRDVIASGGVTWLNEMASAFAGRPVGPSYGAASSPNSLHAGSSRRNSVLTCNFA